MQANRRVFFLAALLSATAVQAAEPASAPTDDQPLTEFPYTPSLDVPSMDRSADPCVDFYQYSCGGWVVHNPIPADQASRSVYGKLYQDNQRLRAKTDPHSPGRYRVNGLVVNMPEFAQAFACKVGLPMVSPKPCRIW